MLLGNPAPDVGGVVAIEARSPHSAVHQSPPGQGAAPPPPPPVHVNESAGGGLMSLHDARDKYIMETGNSQMPQVVCANIETVGGNMHTCCVAPKGATGSTAALRGECCLPTVVVAGTQKSGTTALSAVLLQHPNVRFADRKEVHFFSMPKAFSRGLDNYMASFSLKKMPGTERRLDHFITAEATPYYLHSADACRYMSYALPSAKVIFLLRDPTQRAYSEYKMKLRRIEEGAGLVEAMQMNRGPWLSCLLEFAAVDVSKFVACLPAAIRDEPKFKGNERRILQRFGLINHRKRRAPGSAGQSEGEKVTEPAGSVAAKEVYTREDMVPAKGIAQSTVRCFYPSTGYQFRKHELLAKMKIGPLSGWRRLSANETVLDGRAPAFDLGPFQGSFAPPMEPTTFNRPVAEGDLRLDEPAFGAGNASVAGQSALRLRRRLQQGRDRLADKRKWQAREERPPQRMRRDEDARDGGAKGGASARARDDAWSGKGTAYVPHLGFNVSMKAECINFIKEKVPPMAELFRREMDDILQCENKIHGRRAETGAEVLEALKKCNFKPTPGISKQFIYRSLYAPQLARCEKHLSRDQMLVLSSDELKHDMDSALKKINAFAGLPEFAYPARSPAELDAVFARAFPDFQDRTGWRMQSEYEPLMPELQEEMRKFYAHYNNMLVDMGHPFASAWNP